MNHANLSHLRYFLGFLLGFTAISLFVLARTAIHNGVMYSFRDNDAGRTAPEASGMYTVKVPRRHLSNLRSSALTKAHSKKLMHSSAGLETASQLLDAPSNGVKSDGKIRHLMADTGPKKREAQPLKSAGGKLPRNWRSFIPVGAKVPAKMLRERKSDEAIFSKQAAKWPAEIKWPRPWIRPLNDSHSQDGTGGNAIMCDMNTLTKSIRPRLPEHLELRKFQSLPDRYKILVEPRSQPSCGNSGLVYPWKLLQQQRRKENKIWMLFVVKSAPSYEENRDTVRETWGAQKNFPSHRIFVLFVVGRTTDQNVTANIKSENEKYGDLLQCDFLDHYKMLPIKVLSTFRWMLERDFNIDFFTMTDDDCLVNLPYLGKFFDKNVITKEDYYKSIYCSFRHHTDALPSRKNNKWMVTREQYSKDLYPTFCHGALWTLSLPLMHGLYCVSEITNIGDFFLEDVLITGILREKLNFKETNIKRVVKHLRPDRSTMIFHAGYKKSAESARAKMMNEWDSWRKDWENSTQR